MLDRYGRDDQKAMIEGSITGQYRITFGLTEPEHGSDATHMETRAVPAQRDGVAGWVINGQKMWTTGMHAATHCEIGRASCREREEDLATAAPGVTRED